MLNVGKLKTEAAAQYYIDKVATGVEDYYLHAGEAPGMWLGRQAHRLGLAGEVSAEQLMALLHGVDPMTGQRLAATRRDADRLMGYDLTFRAPKSVSLVHALGDGPVPGAVRSAHEVALQVALAYLEREAAFTRRSIDGAVRDIAGEGFLTAGFQHRTSRAGDPLLHTHVLVPNLVCGVDGRWGAIDGRLLYRHAKAAGALYQAQLRVELTERLWVRWTPVHNGVAEIVGVPAEVISVFSRRRREITAHMAARGETSARAAQVATLETRRGKDYGVSAEGLLPEWKQRAAALEFGPHELAATMTQFPDLAVRSEAAVIIGLLGPEGLTARASSFTRRDALLALCDRLGAKADARDIEGAADRLLEHREVVALGDDDATVLATLTGLRREDGRLLRGPDERRFTTRELLALERQLVDGAMDRRGCGAAVAEPQAVEAALAARPTLSDEQARMCRTLLSGGDGVQVIRGHAGTGKTYALDACRAAWEASGIRVFGAALSARAAAELQAGSAITSSTLHRLLDELGPVPAAQWPSDSPYPIQRALQLDDRTVIVVDEAAMVGTRQLARLLEHARVAGAGVVLVGDDHQLPEIDAGGAFRGLADRLGAVELTDNRRQSEAWEREALRLLRDGRAPEAIAHYEAHGRVVTGDSAEEVRARLVADWWEARGGCGSDGRGDVVMVAARRADVRELNARARELRIAAGEVEGAEVVTRGGRMAVGDEVMTKLNDRQLGVRNGDRGVVVAVDEAAHAVTVRFDEEREGPRVVSLPADYLAAGHLAHAYAFTAHAAQGMTVDRAFVLGDDTVYREWGYVALSRGREENRLYVVASDRTEEIRQALHETSPLAEPAVAQLVASLERSRAQHLALDSGAAIPTVADAEQERLRRLSGDELVAELRVADRGRDPDWARSVEPHPSELHVAERDAGEARAVALQTHRLADNLRARLGDEGWLARQVHRGDRASDQAWLRQLEAEIAHVDAAADAADLTLGELRDRSEQCRRWDDEMAVLRAGDLGLGGAVRGELARRDAERAGSLATRLTQLEASPPTYLRLAIGDPPDGVAARSTWRAAATLIEHHRETHGITDDEPPLGDTEDEAAGRALLRRLDAVRGPIPDDLSGLPAAFELEMARLMRRLPDAAVEPHDEAQRRRIESAPIGYGAFSHDYYYDSPHIAHELGPHVSM